MNPVYNTTDVATICDGDTYQFGTQTLAVAGTFTEVFTTVDGCDSTVVLTLNVNPVYNTTDVATICDGDTYQFGTQTLTAAGTFTEVFTTVDGCDSTVVLTLNVNAVTATTATTDVTCFGNADGSIDVTVSGGTMPYQYLWSNSETTEDLMNLSAGIYSVTITDANGCVAVEGITTSSVTNWNYSITANSHLFVIPAGSITVDGNALAVNDLVGAFYDSLGTLACAGYVQWMGNTEIMAVWGADFGQANGFASMEEITWLALTGGNVLELSVVYLTDPAFTDAGNWVVDGLSGIVTLTGSSVSAGGSSITAVITEPTQIVSNSIISNFNGVNVSCFGGSNGSIVLQLNGGVAPYTYSWSNGSSASFINGLIAGTYTVTIMDANGCSLVENYTLTEPTPISLAGTITNVSCFGGFDGVILITPTGGTAPYSYLWTTNATTNSISGLSIGTYGVQVVDVNGCSIIQYYTVTEPVVLSASLVASDVTCNGGNDGSIVSTVSGGTMPYTYLWSNGETSQDLPAVTAGNYEVTVTDGNACTYIVSVIVNEPSLLEATAQVLTDFNGYGVSCFGNSDGEASVVATGGVSPYTYLWSNSETTSAVSGLSAGTYSVTVTDANNCVAVSVISGGVNAVNWNYSITGNSHLVMIPAGSITIDGNPLAVNDLVGAFYDSLGAMACAGYVQWTGGTEIIAVWGADAGQTNGFTSMEEFTWMVLTGGSAIEVEPVYSTDPAFTDAGNWVVDGLSGLVSLTGTTAVVTNPTVSVVITEPMPIVANAVLSNYNGMNISCYGAANGSIVLQATGGIAPYTYTWSTGSSVDFVNGLVAGVYEITITDFNNCELIETYTLVQPDAIEIVETISHVTCYGFSDGAINLTINGGTAPYSYLWATGQTTQNLVGIPIGTYGVQVTDANGCSLIEYFTITQPDPLVSTISGTNVICNGESNGTIDLSVSDGTMPYAFAWSNSETTEDMANLFAGWYFVTITDANACVLIDSIEITEPDTLGIVFTASDYNNFNVSCYGGSDGDLSAVATGGIAPYLYAWSNSETTTSISGLSAGVYTLTITDDHLCEFVEDFTITEPTPLTIDSFNISDASCFGYNDGSITVNVSGGVTAYAYTYLWSNSETTQTITSLLAGNYEVTVTDANGCTVVESESIVEPDSIEITFDHYVDCTVGGNGSLVANVIGGTSPYTYSWAGPFGVGVVPTTDSISGLVEGMYSLTVTDVNGCTQFDDFYLQQPSQVLSLVIDSVSDVSCNGGNDGFINITAVGGINPYQYVWTFGGNPYATTADITNLVAGIYTIVVTDYHGCEATYAISVGQAAPLAISLSGTDVSCFGNANGSISANITGGTPAYTLVWTNSLGTTINNLNNLVSGWYFVDVVDVNGCMSSDSIFIDQPAQLANSFTVTNVSCFGGNDGQIQANVTGGVAPFTYQWSNTETSGTIANLGVGVYWLTITDANACTLVQFVTITQPTAVSVAGVITNVDCASASTGAIDITVTGGIAPYSFNWTGGITSEDLDTLVAGTYEVMVTDANGCLYTTSYVVTEPPAINIANVITPVACYGESNGEIDITVTGGVVPYSYLWTYNGVTTQDIDGLPAGTHSVVVTDASGCSVGLDFLVSEPPLLTVSALATNVLCAGDATGAIDLTVSGGVMPYAVIWSNGFPLQDLNGLSGGSYTVTVTDANGCTHIETFTITEPTPLVVTGAITDVLCAGNATGAIDLSVSGGVSPYTFAWLNGSTSEDMAGVLAGSYTVTVTDANGCTFVATYTISEPLTLAVTSSLTHVLCNGLLTGAIDLTVSGGVMPYTYSWTGNVTTQDLSAIGAGTYDVTVTDANSCVFTASYVITEPAALSITAVVTNVLCNGNASGAVDITVTGGVSPYFYSWSNGWASQDIYGLLAGTYTVSVIDANNCTIESSFVVSQPSGLAVSETISNVSCYGDSTGVIALNVNGGVSPYSYAWSDGATTSTNSGLAAGFYSYTVSDANGCEELNTIEITQPTELVVTAILSDYNGYNISCHGLSDGWIDVTVTGGVSPYTYSWTPSASTQDLNNLVVGNYALIVIDANGCAAELSYTLTEPVDLDLLVTVSNYNGFGVSCNGECDGDILITPTGGVAPYSYIWNTGAITDHISSLCAGFYSVTVTDANGCFGVQFITITEPMLISFTLSDPGLAMYNGYSISCNGASDGNINVNNLMGGLPPYLFEWTDASGAVVANTQNLTNFGAGVYTLAVTDVNGCVITSTLALTEPPALITSALITTDYNGYSISCNGETDGGIDLTVSGGLSPYAIDWGAAGTNEDLTNIGAGTYTVTVTDLNGCISIETLTLTEPDQLAVSLNATAISCYGEHDGAVHATITGGVMPYTYLWSNAVTAVDYIVGLYAGTYGFTLTDMNGCTVTSSAAVIEPTELLVPYSVTPDECGDNLEGSINLAPTGGTAPYTFAWSTGATTENLTGLASGTYDVTVTDSHGCTVEESIFVPFTGDFPVANFTNVNAGGTVIFVNFSSNGNTYIWDFGDGTTDTVYTTNNVTHQYTSTGYYTVILTVKNDCGSDMDTLTIYVQVTDIEEFEASVLINMFPNPTDGIFTISYETDHFVGDVTVRIFDAVGRVVEEEMFFIDRMSMNRQYDLSSYNYGTYMVQFITKDGVKVKPIILNRR
ncbi:MAG: T9SS type A sorting domain-containing protein [Bacteroidales bacterium]|nr:T9SS type A sorting domain-containing protein [Bacteroidales bacterium]